MRVAVLGGSFDPPHNGHLHIAKMLLKHKLCDKIILMPHFLHPFGKESLDPSHRLAMTKLLETKNIEVFDLEIKKEKISYTIDTLKALKTQSAKDDFVWIIGEDQIKDFRKWKDWKEIVERFGLIVVPRYARPPRGSPTATPEAQVLPTSEVTEGLLGGERPNIIVIDTRTFKPLNISSSEIRKRIKEGLLINQLVPKGVEKYIIKNKLYR